MDLMAIRRRIMMAQRKNTAPIILMYGYKYPSGNKAPTVDATKCITDKYRYEPSTGKQTLVTCGVTSTIHIFNDTRYMDYWSWSPGDGYKRKVINPNSTQVACTVVIDQLDVCYAYLEETGQILFAGEKSPYYGYENINDMPNH